MHCSTVVTSAVSDMKTIPISEKLIIAIGGNFPILEYLFIQRRWYHKPSIEQITSYRARCSGPALQERKSRQRPKAQFGNLAPLASISSDVRLQSHPFDTPLLS